MTFTGFDLLCWILVFFIRRTWTKQCKQCNLSPDDVNVVAFRQNESTLQKESKVVPEIVYNELKNEKN